MSENENGDCSAEMFGDFPVFVDGIAGVFNLGNFSVMYFRWLWQGEPLSSSAERLRLSRLKPAALRVCRMSGVGECIIVF